MLNQFRLAAFRDVSLHFTTAAATLPAVCPVVAAARPHNYNRMGCGVAPFGMPGGRVTAMVESSGSRPESDVALHLLDSAQGHPLQTWRFSDQASITIGREDQNDIVITDSHVSRLHARLALENGCWKLISVGRHGTLLNDEPVTEAPIAHRAVFRLGPLGPLMRFDVGRQETSSVTMDTIDPDMFNMLEVDHERKQAEVDAITKGALFEDLRQQSRRVKTLPHPDDKS
jgi:hypothetical protein